MFPSNIAGLDQGVHDEVTVFSGHWSNVLNFRAPRPSVCEEWVLRLSFSVRRAQLLKLAAIGASPLNLRVDLPANQERQPGDVQPRQ
jgi:hypothetical protein